MKTLTTKIELLAPARNLETGMAAINYGADAVYIGANRFSARSAVGNSVQDIEKLAIYAHKYHAKVFVALNTILYDNELNVAEDLVRQVYEAGADALIIQDLGILEMDIPPLPIHASTQTNNYDSERIKFLDQLGLDRIILARELSLKEIKTIRQHTTSELEFFVHGALCVSFSGQCYFSHTMTGKSANRGECAQMCRHAFNLLDANDQHIRTHSHLLSLKDLNLSNHLKQLIEAGITSLKIEGRLKDINYVKNVVSYYRQKLDLILKELLQHSKASSGSTSIQFEPDPEKSFSRKSTSYFLTGRSNKMVNHSTPKSMGKRIGTINTITKEYCTINLNETLHNGDGLCFIRKNQLLGIRVQKVVDERVYVSDLSGLSVGMELYRNYDHEFNKRLESDRAVRKVPATIDVFEENNKLVFQIIDEDGHSIIHKLPSLPEKAQNIEMANNTINTQLGKSGDSIFDVNQVNNNCKTAWFFRKSELNEIRRTLYEMLEQERISKYVRKTRIKQKIQPLYPKSRVDFSENISNKNSEQFYKNHGVEQLDKALEISIPHKNQLLMTTRYCIKYELGFCTRFQQPRQKPQEPLFLQDKNRKYLLQFDCKNCLMKILLD